MRELPSNPHTVFVLGAGCSVPYGFPTGAALKETVQEHLLDDQYAPARERFARHGVPLARAAEIGRDLVHTRCDTIDEYLDGADSEEASAVKTIVASYLLERERWFARSNVFPGDWIKPFSKWMMGTSEPTVGGVAILTFNYDRTVECHLHRKIRADARKQRVAPRWKDIPFPILHLHGALGPTDGESDWWTALDADPTPDQVRAAAGAMLMVSDPILEDRWELARQFLREASRIVFCGFGYHKALLDRLECTRQHGFSFAGRTVAASRHRMDDDVVSKIADELGFGPDWLPEASDTLKALEWLGNPFMNTPKQLTRGLVVLSSD
jgi:hypothetical protein